MSKYTISVSIDGSTITETANHLVISETLAVLAGPSSGAAVTSVNGKSGAVTLTASDVGAPSTSGSYTNPSWIVSLPWSKVTATPTTLSGYGISDGITAAAVASGYASLSGSYSNPAWITGLAWSKVSGTPTTRSGYGITDAQPLDAELTALASLVSAADSFPYFTGSGTAALFTIGATQRAAIGNLSGTNTGDQTITLTGDVTGSGTGSFAATLANVVTGATVGSSTLVPVITFDAKGRITAATTAAITSLPTQTGNNGKYLTTDGTNASWATVSVAGSALTGSSLASGITSSSLTSFGNNPSLAGSVTFDGFVVSTSPYSSQTYARIIATNAATNVNVVVGWKGTGSFALQQADGSAGGNQLGANAVDLSLHSSGTPSYCASGANSFAACYLVKAGGQYSGVGGTSSESNGTGSFVWAANTVASGNWSATFGQVHTTSGNFGLCSGYGHTLSGAYSSAHGYGHTVTSLIASANGSQCLVDKRGQHAWAADAFASAGDAQRSHLVARNSTSNATPTNLFLDGSSARITIPANTTWEFEAHIVARTASATGTYAKFVRSGIISRNSTVGSTAIATVDTIGTDRGSNANTPPAGWAVAITADTTNGALDIQVTGAAATNIRWVAHIMITEVAYP